MKVLFFTVGRVDGGPLLAYYIGNILIGAGLISVGVFTSSFTQNQLIAVFSSIAIILFLLIAGNVAALFQEPVNTFLTYIGTHDHLDNFSRGSIGLPDFVYALSMIGVPLYLSVVSLGARRWH
jgi:ABC-2 type transport system permease protein